MKLNAKHSSSDTTIFTEMTMLAQKYNAINLAQGFPDYETDPKLKSLLAKATENNHNQYAPLGGNPFLIEQLKNFNSKRNQPISIDNNEITITPGATYAIYTALSAILDFGDEVIIIEPAYDCYQPAIEMNGGKPIFVYMDDNFNVHWDSLKDKITEKTKAIIVNTPHNPSGKIWKKEDWEQLWQIIKNTDIIVISDEVYDLIYFDNHSFHSALSHPEIRKRCFAIFSFGKMFHITGWKVGYIVTNEEFTKAFRRVHQFITFCVNAPAQQALAEYLDIFDVEENQKLMQQKRDFFISEMKDLPFTMKEATEGSYFQVIGYENISSLNDKEFTYWLTENHKVATIPLSAFYHDKRNTNTIRFCFSKKEETILQAVKNLKSIQ